MWAYCESLYQVDLIFGTDLLKLALCGFAENCVVSGEDKEVHCCQANETFPDQDDVFHEFSYNKFQWRHVFID